MTKSILFVAIDFPPKPGPGANRNYYLHKHFNQSGWKSHVLTAKQSNYDKVDDSLNELEGVIEAAGRDSTKVLSLFGKYPKFIAIPDRWYLWVLPAFLKGKKQLKECAAHYIYTSYPNYSSAIVGALLSKVTKTPLILDLRDPFRFRYDPKNVPVHWLYKKIEKFVVKQANTLITTTPECATLYKKLYPELSKIKTLTIPNGFSKEFHQSLQIQKKDNKKFTLLHSGNLYQIGRDPTALLQAISQLVKTKVITKENFTLIFRGASPWKALQNQINELQLNQFVEFKPSISYKASIQEMYSADVNLLIQNEIFNLQIPSKLYDLIAIKKPLIAITNKNGALSKEMTRLKSGFFSSNADTLSEHIKALLEQGRSDNTHPCCLELSREKINANLANTLTTHI